MSTTQPIKIRISSPGKVILHGEHSVVYGKLAVAASLGLRTRLEYCENIEKSNLIIVNFPDLSLSKTIDLKVIQNLIGTNLPLTATPSSYNLTTPELLNLDEIINHLNLLVLESSDLDVKQRQALLSFFYLFWGFLGIFHFDIPPFSLTVNTDLTVSAGTGSSASFAVCLSSFLFQLIRLKKPKIKNNYKHFSFTNLNCDSFNKFELDLISKWAFQSERIIHGTPSGVDNTICTYGGLVEFRKGTNPQLVELSTKFKTILINTKVSRDTKKLVALVAAKRQKYTKLIDQILESMDFVACEALNIMKQLNGGDFLGGYDTLGELTDFNQNFLRLLGVSHPKLDEICLFLAEYGLHGKLTGAGGGGYAICLIPPSVDDNTILKVIEGLELKGFDAVLTDLGGCGVDIDKT